MEDGLSILNEWCKRLAFAVLHALPNVTKARFSTYQKHLTCSLTLNDMMSSTLGMMLPAFFSPIARVWFRASLDKNCKKSIESSSESPRPFSFDYKSSESDSLPALLRKWLSCRTFIHSRQHYQGRWHRILSTRRAQSGRP